MTARGRCIWTNREWDPTLHIRGIKGAGSVTSRSAYSSRSSGSATDRSGSQTARYRPSKINRSGGQGISPEELDKIRNLVGDRLAVEEDEEWLAEQQRMLRPGPFHMGEFDRSDGLSDDENSNPIVLRMPKNPRGQRDKQPARDADVETSPPITFRGNREEKLLEHGFTLGGDNDKFQLSSDAGEKLTLKTPSCVTALPDGELCIADTGSHRLIIVTPEGQPRAVLHGGEGRDALKLPRGVVSDATALYVSEVGGSRVRKMRLPEEFRVNGAMTARGSHLGGLSLNAESELDGQLTFPQGLALDRGELFVADCEDHRIAVYDAHSLTYLRSFGGPSAYGEPRSPRLITIPQRSVCPHPPRFSIL